MPYKDIKTPARCALLLLITLAMPTVASAGLVFEFDRSLNVDGVRAVSRTGRGLVFQTTGGSHTLVLSPPVQDAVLEWAKEYKGGPVVISIDGSLVPGGEQYYPPSTPAPLGEYLLSLDSYAHQVSCGSLPEGDRNRHPLRARAGEEALPHKRHLMLLDETNHSAEALWYRRLAGRYTTPPGCVGELTLRVRSNKGAWPIRLEPSAWLHTITRQWYRDIDVPSPWDNWAARLPYKALKQDMEQHWDSYRQAMPRLDELSSIVEALAVLHLLRERSPQLWRTLLSQPTPDDTEPEQPSPKLELPRIAVTQWRALSRVWVGDSIRTTAQANLALSLLIEDPSILRELRVKWLREIQDVAAHDPRMQAKLALLAVLATPAQELAANPQPLRTTLTLLRGSFGGSFRLRAHALNRLEQKHAHHSIIGPMLMQESARLLADFMEMANQRCTAPASAADADDFEDLSQDVYSVGLLNRANILTGQHEDLVRAVACIHARRGLAPQVGRELAYQHAHFRFLTYLQRHARSPELRQEIASNRDRMAAAIGLLDY